MTYLFGDSSPSSLEIDYIEFLREALDFSVSVLAAHERMVQGAARAVDIKREGDAEIQRLESLGAVVARAVEGFDIGADTSATATCAQGLLRGAAETVTAAIDRVRAGGAGDAGKIEDEARRDRERCVEALGTFLKRHDLPKMTSELRLQQEGGTAYAARLYVRALDGVQAVLDLDIPTSHLLGTVARVDKLAERLEVHAPETGGWLRKEVKLRPQRLDKEFITAVVASANQTLIQLRAAADGSGVGFDLAIPEDGVRVSLRRVGEGSELPPFDLDETDSAKVRELKDKLLASTTELKRARRGLVEAALGDKPLAEARDPKVIVERLVAEMAPVVREIAKRSLAPTELVLKRQTGDGRREEIFVSRRDLQVKLKGLGAEARKAFAPLELGELPADAEDPPTLKKIDKDVKSVPILLTEKKKPAPLFADALAVDKVAADKAPIAEKAPAGKPIVEKAAVEKTEKAPATKSAAATSSPKSDPAVVLDDSIERLIVSEETRKP